MTTATRKRTQSQKKGQTRRAETAPRAEQNNAPTSPLAVNNGATVSPNGNHEQGERETATAALVAAYWHAIDQRDETTGRIPAEPTDAVRTAARALTKRQRNDAAMALSAEAHERFRATDDASLVVAMADLFAQFGQVNAERATRTGTPHDPVSDVAGNVAALDALRAELLAPLTDEQRARVDEVDVEADETAQAAKAAAMAKLAPNIKRALHGRRSGTGRTGTPRTGPARDLAALVRDALDGSTEPKSVAEIAREHEASTGALNNRWTAETIPGVASVKDAAGRKAFQLVG